MIIIRNPLNKVRLVARFCGCIIAVGLIVVPNTSSFALNRIDSDGDKLNDELELKFKSDRLVADTDDDGYSDGIEVQNGYSPTDAKPIKLEKKIHVSLTKQRLSYYLGGVVLGSMTISSGKASMPTPQGQFVIMNKHPRAWSKLAGLWMPYWMGFAQGKYGIHELPQWPNGRWEGEQHLGIPVSHGCIRIGKNDAQQLYEWTPVGTKLIISNN